MRVFFAKICEKNPEGRDVLRDHNYIFAKREEKFSALKTCHLNISYRKIGFVHAIRPFSSTTLARI